MANGPAGGPIPPRSSSGGPARVPRQAPPRSPSAPPERPSERYRTSTPDRLRDPDRFETPDGVGMIGRQIARRAAPFVAALWPDDIGEEWYGVQAQPRRVDFEPPELPEAINRDDVWIAPDFRGFEVPVLPAIERWYPPTIEIEPPAFDLNVPVWNAPAVPLVRSMPEPGFETPRLVRRSEHSALEMALSVHQQDGVPVVRARVAPRAATRLAFPRYRDTKIGRKLIGYAVSMINKTYGAYSEAADFTEIMAWSMYGKVGDRVVPAMQIEGFSMMNVFQGYLAGDYRLDVVGFVADFTINQMGDYVIGRYGQHADQSMWKAGWQGHLGISSETYGQGIGADHVSEVWNEASSGLRSLDAQRAGRVRSLFF